jgi:general secretion pathway protein C
MDLAKNLAQWRDQSPEQWIALGNRYLPPIVVALLVLLLAFKAADLTWRLLDSRAVQDVVPLAAEVQAAAGTQPAGVYESLAAWEPFGRAPDESSEAISADLLLDAPDTTLNLTLHSAWEAQELPERGSMVVPERGNAIISSGRGGAQHLYWTGEELEDVGSVRLHSVFKDRVLLDRGSGRLETLRFPETESTPQLNSRVAVRADIQLPQNLSSAASIQEAVGQAAEMLSQHMQIAMHTENGQMVGFRLEPLGDGQVFSQLGLEAGDILTDVNGQRLDNIRNTTQVIRALGESAQASVTIRRNGADMGMVLNIGDIQRLAESLQ